MEVKNLGFSAVPIADLKKGLRVRINNNHHDRTLHGRIRRIIDAEIQPDGYKKVTTQDTGRLSKTYEYHPSEVKNDILHFLDFLGGKKGKKSRKP